MPYHVICHNCGQLLYSAATIPDRACPECGHQLPEPRPGSPPLSGPASDADEPLAIHSTQRASSV